MPRDGDPMTDLPDRYGPTVFGPRTAVPTRPPEQVPGKSAPTLPRPGRQTIFLHATSANGGSVVVVFSKAAGCIHFWRSLDPQKRAVQHVATFPGKFSPLAVARLLASGAVRPAIDVALLDEVEVDGADGWHAALLKLAWTRLDGVLDPRVVAVLRLATDSFDEVAHRMGSLDEEGLLVLGAYLIKNDARWLAEWCHGIDAEVDRRAAVDGAGEARRRLLRAFVEECLLLLGRLPRPDETEESWAGSGLRDGSTRRRIPELTDSGRVGRYRIRVHFWTALDTYGYSDFGPGPGWYWVVANPNPNWRFCDPTGPYDSPRSAWADANCVGQE